MTDSDVIQKALGRLDNFGVYVEHVDCEKQPSVRTVITEELAALIRDAAKPWFSGGVRWCRGCGCRYDAPHADDDTDRCTLITLCKAITGEKL